MDTDVCSQETSVCDIWSRRVNSVTRNNHDVISVSMRSNSGASQKDPTGYAGRHPGAGPASTMPARISCRLLLAGSAVTSHRYTDHVMVIPCHAVYASRPNIAD